MASGQLRSMGTLQERECRVLSGPGRSGAHLGGCEGLDENSPRRIRSRESGV